MPLSSSDRQFLNVVQRLKIYLLVLAAAVFVFLLLAPEAEVQSATSIVGVALCGVFWLTQRLLSFISLLDLELTRVVNVLRRTLPEEQRRNSFPDLSPAPRHRCRTRTPAESAAGSQGAPQPGT
jgi:hypothetical protein